MNPLFWTREHQCAWFAVVATGVVIGTYVAWIESPIYKITTTSPSAIGGPGQTFLLWLAHIGSWWPWPAFGALTFGLAFYAFQLARKP